MTRVVWAGVGLWAWVASAGPLAAFKGESIELAAPVRFDAEEELVPDALPALDELAKLLESHPECLVVELAASAEGGGAPQELVERAEDRAEAVIEYLIKQGIASKRLVSKGLGPKAASKGRSLSIRVLKRAKVPATVPVAVPEVMAAVVETAPAKPPEPPPVVPVPVPVKPPEPVVAAPAPTSLATLRDGVIELVGTVRFKQELDEILPESLPLLDDVAALLRAQKKLKRVQVEGHTDRLGSKRDNLVLSKKRAVAVVAYLVEHGVSRKRLSAKGYGETRPIAPNDTREGREQNRRVAFTLLK